ncbi:hypothetical protein [Thioalkalivibrio sp. ALE19]|uniref:hypothetical protein n=1 Tax=Thioalkalivibrio sp. ALE19 TaxID=1266909 RepID=UPI000429212B|nr:hypothetical protein [Thioalkalivibrio sp. ALE19]
MSKNESKTMSHEPPERMFEDPNMIPDEDWPQEANDPLEKSRHSAEDYLRMAAEEMRDRAASRDNPEGERSMGRCVNAMNALYGDMIRRRIEAGLDPLSETLGWEFASLLKKARKGAGKYREDDYVDDVSYVALSAESAAQENQNDG